MNSEIHDSGSSHRRAFRRALAMLSYRSRSRKEIVCDLLGRGFCDETVSGVIAELEEKRLVNDALLARDIVLAGQRSNKSRSRIYTDLRKRGIERALAEVNFQTCFDKDKELEAAVLMMRRLLPPEPSRPTDEDTEKAARKLCGRGFSPSAVANALEYARGGARIEGESSFLDTDSQLS